MTRRSILVALLLTLATLTSTSLASADSTANDCADGVWTVEAGQTLGKIAFACGTTVGDIAWANGILNPNYIYVGQRLTLPAGSAATPAVSPPTTSANPAAPAQVATGAVTVTWGAPLYPGDGKMVDFPITVTNNSVQPAIAGGRYLLGHGVGTPDGPMWITLLGAIHDTIPYPYVTVNEPLWHATVYTDDGLVFPAYVGCKYIETVYAQGDEPLDRGAGIWFHWEVTLPGGWFDCGNSYQVKPEDILPGQTASSVLTAYMMHPREEAWFATRRVVRVDLELFTTTGESLGIVSSQTFE